MDERSMVPGRRLPTPQYYDDPVVFPGGMQPGDYWKDFHGEWWAYFPRGGVGRLGNHTITEHEDGTISVSPSLLVFGGEKRENWHGYLEHGVWREV